MVRELDPLFKLRRAYWPEDEAYLKDVRTNVFIQEQKVPVELEWDGLDQNCIHLLAFNHDERAIATARLTSTGHIGRMAVLAPYRNKGIGSALLKELIIIAKEKKHSCVILNAQIHARKFYQRLHFVAEGKPFDDAGIPHIKMILSLEK